MKALSPGPAKLGLQACKLGPAGLIAGYGRRAIVFGFLIAFKRFLLLALIWLALTGAEPGGMVFGLFAAAGGAWLSLRLLPPAHRGVSLAGLARMLPGFLWRSILGGVDVAWRALHPRMPLNTGWVVLPTALPEGGAQVALGGEFSLLPGTLVAGTRDGMLLVHCLDKDQEIAGQILLEEDKIAGSMGLRLARDAVRRDAGPDEGSP